MAADRQFGGADLAGDAGREVTRAPDEVCSARLCCAIADLPVRRAPKLTGVQPKVAKAEELHKKTTFRSTNGMGIEGRVMVHRTDIAGGGSMRQPSPRHDTMWRRALNGSLLDNDPSRTAVSPSRGPTTNAALSLWRESCRSMPSISKS